MGGGEELDGVPADLQDKVSEDGHLRPSLVQQLKVGIPDSLGRERVWAKQVNKTSMFYELLILTDFTGQAAFSL